MRSRDKYDVADSAEIPDPPGTKGRQINPFQCYPSVKKLLSVIAGENNSEAPKNRGQGLSPGLLFLPNKEDWEELIAVQEHVAVVLTRDAHGGSSGMRRPGTGAGVRTRIIRRKRGYCREELSAGHAGNTSPHPEATQMHPPPHHRRNPESPQVPGHTISRCGRQSSQRRHGGHPLQAEPKHCPLERETCRSRENICSGLYRIVTRVLSFC
jgi:hypothetical protein